MTLIWRDYGERHAGVFGEADDVHFVRSGPGTRPECLVCWEWYLDSIMEGVGPGPGGWTALALEYHVGSRWKEGEWQVPSVDAALEQLRRADRAAIDRAPRGPTALAILNDLIKFFEAAEAAGQIITISSH